MRLQSKILFQLFMVLSSLSGANNTVGLILHEAEAAPGYTLFTPNSSKSTYLIDNDGLLVREWVDSSPPLYTAYLLEDGSLLRAARISSPNSHEKGGFRKYAWDGELLWEFFHEGHHHDVEPLPNGNVLMIAADIKDSTQSIEAGRNPAILEYPETRSLSILEIEQVGLDSGVVVWEWHAWDHLIQDFDSSKSNYGDVDLHPERIDVNYSPRELEGWLHSNSVAYNESLDQILLSNRSTDDIWIIDHSTTSAEAAGHSGGNAGKGGDLLYRWGNPESYGAGTIADKHLFKQHDAEWISPGFPGAGNILVFNNGVRDSVLQNYSSVLEIIPPLQANGLYSFFPGSKYYGPDAPVWEYYSDDSYNFEAKILGGSQRLKNGNTLICSPLDGKFFEVTPSGSVVWIYINPVSNKGILSQGDEAAQNIVARCHRYAPDYPGLLGKDLTPGEPIELYPSDVSSTIETPNGFVLLENYPNPFNPVTSIKYSLPNIGSVKLSILNLRGLEVATLMEEVQAAGNYEYQWGGVDHRGNPVASGVYFARLQIGEYSKTIKMVHLK